MTGEVSADSAYSGATIVFATMHGKQRQAAPSFRQHHDATLVAPGTIDTDQFGTFVGDVPRTLAPWAAALAKAKLGVTLTGFPFALASEASYSTSFGVVAQHQEILLFHDSTRDITITEVASASVPDRGSVMAHTKADIDASLAGLGFPTTQLVLSAETPSGLIARKGLDSYDAIHAAAVELFLLSDELLIQPDYRALANPERQRVIAELAERLAVRLRRRCPRCATPGWGRVGVERGLPCLSCGEPTAGIRADVDGCAQCDHRVVTVRDVMGCDPQWCDYCNP